MPAATQGVVVIGAGIGGLAAALRLAAAGLPVTVLEQAATPGGKLREVHVGGQALDAGPTVFTLRQVFDELFALAGTSLDAQLRLQPLTLLARHAWGADARLDLFADRQRSADAMAHFAGPAAGRQYLAFCTAAARLFEHLQGSFMQAQRPGLLELGRRLGPAGLLGLAGQSPFSSLWEALSRQFREPRLRQLFGRYATYCGSSPFAAPATLMLIAHAEQRGVWSVEGGMYRLAERMAALCTALGVQWRLGEAVSTIEVSHGRVQAVSTASGERLSASAVICNADVAALGLGLLGAAVRRAAPAPPRSARSLSALAWCVLARCSGFPLVRHNVFFSRDYHAEFDDLFRRRRLPAEPTVYICAQDRGDAAAAGEGGGTGAERLLCLVNAPADGDLPVAETGLRDEDIARCERHTRQMLAGAGLQLQHPPEHWLPSTPRDFARLFPGTGGALYGRASHGWKASFERPGARSAVPGLYLAGGSVHPSAGLPMAATSGRLAAEALLADRDAAAGRRRGRRYASTARCAPAATPGGTSTR